MNNYGNLVLIGVIIGILLFPIAIPLYFLYKWYVKKMDKQNKAFIVQERKKTTRFNLVVYVKDKSDPLTQKFNDRVQAVNIMLSIKQKHCINSAILNDTLTLKAYLWDNTLNKFIDNY